ncbi:MAG: hypothetical protein LBE09_02900 [Christensenellaceae bacterium]|nr:hypothetical protein [Christensenellaceae bacterium]
MTGAIATNIAKDVSFIALANLKDGKMYYTSTTIDRHFAISIMNFNTNLSVYTFYGSNARGITQETSYHVSPVHDSATKTSYFAHYHLGNTPRDFAVAHAFYGTPRLI